MNSSGKIKDEEIATFDKLFGEGTFGDKLDLERLEEHLDQRIKDANNTVPLARRIHIIRDLCLIAVADGRVTQKERKYVHTVARKLQLSPIIVAP